MLCPTLIPFYSGIGEMAEEEEEKEEEKEEEEEQEEEEKVEGRG